MTTTEKSNLLRQGTSTLRPRARLIRAIGQDLITNEVIALIELIKNAYDADADSVTVRFVDPLRPSEGEIVISDDGVGMSADVLQAAWMEPASPWKKERPRSAKGRRVTGEKGLGRFAAARLADHMHVDSVSGNPPRRVTAEFDWKKVDDPATNYLDEIGWDWSEYEAPAGTPSGTTFRLQRLRDEWTDKILRRLRGELARLIARPSQDTFTIDLQLPTRFHHLAGVVTPPAVLSRPHYALSGATTSEGVVSATLTSGGRQEIIEFRIRGEREDSPQCGPFSFEFSVWDRDRLDALSNELGASTRDLRRDLNEAAGISVYRDVFRIGHAASSDWLRLDIRRVQNPTMRISNNQIVGAVYISADQNPELRDQTNREGLIETAAYADFKSAILQVLAQIEKLRYVTREQLKQRSTTVSLFAGLDLKDVRESFRERYPNDREFLSFLDDKDSTLRTRVNDIQQVVIRYRRLATLGQLVDILLHDGRTPIASISNEVTLAARELQQTSFQASSIRRRLQTIEQQASVLSHLFRRIAPFGGRRRTRATTQVLERLIADTFALHQATIDRLKVHVVLPTTVTELTLDAAEFQQVIINLLDNALYWLQNTPADQRAIIVSCRGTTAEVEIVFSDSGPGIPADGGGFVFDPYFSTKPEGVGLGLTIAGEIVAELGGVLETVDPGPLPGATFRLVLPKRVEGRQ